MGTYLFPRLGDVASDAVLPGDIVRVQGQYDQGLLPATSGTETELANLLRQYFPNANVSISNILFTANTATIDVTSPSGNAHIDDVVTIVKAVAENYFQTAFNVTARQFIQRAPSRSDALPAASALPPTTSVWDSLFGSKASALSPFGGGAGTILLILGLGVVVVIAIKE